MFQVVIFLLKLTAFLKISLKFVTEERSQLSKCWLNTVADSNILSIVVTLEVSQSFNGWLNEFAAVKVPLICVTLEVSQSLISWLKEVAP